MKKITILLLLSIILSVQAQISESFEGSFPPTGWAAFPGTSGSSDAEWVPQDEYSSSYSSYGWAHTGDFGLISSWDWEGLTEGWLVTPQFTPTAAEPNLYFHLRQAYEDDYFSEFSVRVSTATQNIADFTTTLVTLTEADISFKSYELQTIDLSAYIDTPIYIAFVHAQDDDDEMYIDDVLSYYVEPPGPTINPIPADGATDVAIINTQTSHIAFSWDAPTTGGTVSQYNFEIGPAADDLDILGHPTSFSANPGIFHFNTTYFWKAAALNMGGNSSDTWSFTTSMQPTVTTPYTIDFENDGNVPDGCDQLINNTKFWQYSNDVASTYHVGNAGSFEGTTTDSDGYFAYVNVSSSGATDITFNTPYIDFTGIDNPAVSFYIISNNEGGNNVNFSVKAKYLDTGVLSDAIYTSNTNTAGWEKVVIDLSNDLDCSSPFQLYFIIDEIESNINNDDFAIDDIVFDDYNNLTASINTQAINGLRYYPNPVKDNLTIIAQEVINQIEVYNLMGQLVHKELCNNDSISLDTSNFASGNYFIKITTDNKQNTIKFVKE